MSGKRAEKTISFMAIALLLVLLFVGGAQPQAVGLFAAPWDKLAHIGFYFVFAYLLLHRLSLPLFAALALSLLVSTADELHQSFLPGRVAGFDDWLADLLGMGLAAWVKRVSG